MSRNAVEQRKLSFLFQTVADARHRLLLMDYEGIVAPSLSHECAPPYPRILGRLDCIMKECSTHLIAISGRPAIEVGRMLGIRAVQEIWGGDGLERLHCDGRYERDQLDIPTDAFEAVAESGLVLQRVGLGKFVEVKLASVSVHWRGMSDLDDILDVRARACRALRPLTVKHPSLCLNEFEGGIEIRLRGATKADFFRRLLSATPAETPIAYIGDDRVDKDSLSVLNDWSLSFLVRRSPNSTATQVQTPGDEVIRFLDDWIRASRGYL